MTIGSDTSQLGWGAVCAGTRTEGAWSVQEQSMHINSLELLAATLAVKTFLKDASGILDWTMLQQWLTSTIWGAPF